MATSEMVIASALLLKNRKTRKLASFDPNESIRSIQLYGVRPDQIKEAVRLLVSECGVSHVDLNFGCPVRKITSRGGGSALPLRPHLFGRLVAAAVAGARGEVPVTVKIRVGLTPELQTHLQAGRIAESEGAAAITLHARTADQLYSPPADWAAVRQLVEAVRVPVIGNGDVDTLMRFRKYIALYLYGFQSAVQLKARLLAATSLDQWRTAVHDADSYDVSEPFPACAVRHPRLKGGGPLVRQRMGLPDGWLDEHTGGGAGAEERLSDEACEG
ncbi:hypothetical protein GPECTOR_5g250 [Gonium pectorale]|uniref:tRNA-dihydrouridine(47) synthase [NAD(P)(+)] n=1 Tax=Gonium pectorale TaxID=33097 RepID=A0A150GWR4_GONPE|nr:hypothetical protein GPECTOR_5g250 [Gonium pectorale]|eukprot:KXZ54152.1 hypothetical protein GPECTOR_5g250 [Gonium pectorale]